MRAQLLVALAVLVGPTFQPAAHAWFRFRNSTPKVVYVAFARYKPDCKVIGGDPWEKEGWWRLEPGQTKTVQGETITNRYSYYYAESEDGSLVWTSGGPATCLPQPAFTWCWDICNTSHTTRLLNMQIVDTDGYDNYTVNLVLAAARAGAPLAPESAKEDATEDRAPTPALGRAKTSLTLPQSEEGSRRQAEAGGALESSSEAPATELQPAAGASNAKAETQDRSPPRTAEKLEGRQPQGR